MARLLNNIPVELRVIKGRNSIGIGDALALSRVIEPGETRELVSPALGYCHGEILLEIAEKQKRCASSELFTHKKQWRRRREQDYRHRRAYGARICNINDPLSECPVSDLVMILQE